MLPGLYMELPEGAFRTKGLLVTLRTFFTGVNKTFLFVEFVNAVFLKN